MNKGGVQNSFLFFALYLNINHRHYFYLYNNAFFSEQQENSETWSAALQRIIFCHLLSTTMWCPSIYLLKASQKFYIFHHMIFIKNL